ncbi:hypothetical protein GCM10010193_58060 [Kitasatospora atroaurantiaca]
MQTLAWVLLIVGVMVAFRKQLTVVAHEIARRLQKGGGFEFGVGVLSVKLAELRDELPHYQSEMAREAAPVPVPEVNHNIEGLPDPESPGASAVWEQYRLQLNEKSRGIQLAHVISPSKVPRQRFDVFVYLVTSRTGSLDEVERAQFFLGRRWGNRVFDVLNEGGRIGFSTAAYGSPLCACRVVFKDGSDVVLSRFLDFEMASVFETNDQIAPGERPRS